jgi:hypothetical protein
MKKAFIFFIACVFIKSTNAQLPSATRVVFADGGDYTGKVLSRTTEKIKIEFLHSHSIYELNNYGIILSSTGKYPKGQKVKSIMIKDAAGSIYNERKISDTVYYLGIKFSDGQVYFCARISSGDGEFECGFTHSKNYYTMNKQGEIWQVYKTDKGSYPPGHVLLEIYILGSGWFFYNDGGNSISSPYDLPREN